ncbi:MAG: nucleoside hydrolase [Vicinamibacteria bacterium]|nr:nucleoside hydrolase [Vicinamibacteria bacterium]
MCSRRQRRSFSLLLVIGLAAPVAAQAPVPPLNAAGNQLVAWSIPSQPRMKVLLDTDIGTDIDDAWALGLLMVSPQVDLVGVTISDGNTAARAKVAAKLLHAGGRGEVPVASGRATPPPDSVDYQFTWAEDFTAVRPIAQSAADFIVETLRRHPGEITLLAVGPLQNIADALRKEPNLGTLAKRVVLMSGSIGGNVWSPTPVAEWNVVRATTDAQLVYSTAPLTIVPLDSTTYVKLRADERARLETHPAAVTRALEALYRLWIGDPTQQMTLHDQMAVAEALQPGAFFGRCTSMPIRVDDKGFTRVDSSGGKPVSVCLEPKRNAFMKFYIDGLLQAK